MIKLFKTDLHTIAAALTLGALSIGIAPAAMAVSTYDATSSFSLTLTNVTDLAGNQVTSGWEVSAISDPFEQSDVTGAATASVTNIVDPGTPISILDTILTSSTASGTASNGTGSSTGDIGLDILASNFSGQALSFSFEYEAIASTMTLGDATAETVVDILDNLGSVDFTAESNTGSGPLPGDTGNGLLTLNGIINFDLLDGEFNNIGGFVFSFGQATAVPVPAAVWLFGSGLLGLVGIARRRKAA